MGAGYSSSKNLKSRKDISDKVTLTEGGRDGTLLLAEKNPQKTD